MNILKFFGLQRIEKSNNNALTEMSDVLGGDGFDQRRYEKNLATGIESLKKFGQVNIYEIDRGYELALDIKRSVILEEQRRLSEKIVITTSKQQNGLYMTTITIK